MARYIIQVQRKRRFFCDTELDMAVGMFEAWRDEEGFGMRDIGARFPLFISTDETKPATRIGSVFYNGRVELNVSPVKPSGAQRIADAKKAKRLAALQLP